ncbi:MAG: hypothetical protein Kow0037_10960 [Calditrichia bacterium]
MNNNKDTVFNQRIGQVYDRLLPRRSGRPPETIHKRLKVPDERKGEYAPENQGHFINDLIYENINWPENPVVLDAGCGTGGTIWRLWPKVKGEWHGMTLSGRHFEMAKRIKTEKFPRAAVRFFRQSYDEPLPGKYDVIIAIEALNHSGNLRQTLQNFIDHLKPGGYLAVVDDLLADDVKIPKKYAAWLERYWAVPQLWANGDYPKIAENLGMRLAKEINLTELVRWRPGWQIYTLLVLLNPARFILPLQSLRQWCGIQLAGIGLQQLYRKGALQYWCRIWQKSSCEDLGI